MKSIDEQVNQFVLHWAQLLRELKPQIGDEYRASEYEDKPGMCVTIGFTPETEDKDCSWSYQTGDNSYSRRAYCHPHWAVISLYRRSNCHKLAMEAAEQILEVAA